MHLQDAEQQREIHLSRKNSTDIIWWWWGYETNLCVQEMQRQDQHIND